MRIVDTTAMTIIKYLAEQHAGKADVEWLKDTINYQYIDGREDKFNVDFCKRDGIIFMYVNGESLEKTVFYIVGIPTLASTTESGKIDWDQHIINVIVGE